MFEKVSKDKLDQVVEGFKAWAYALPWPALHETATQYHLCFIVWLCSLSWWQFADQLRMDISLAPGVPFQQGRKPEQT